MSKKARSSLQRYDSLRLQLAERHGEFLDAARRFPDFRFEILQADYSMGPDEWFDWIKSNRADPESHESFDVYPHSCWGNRWSLEELEIFEGKTSRYCGRYRSASGSLSVAVPLFEQLSERANRILYALKAECDKHRQLEECTSFSNLSPGYRGWLDSVRNTAELNRSAYLDVENRIWNAKPDLLSTKRAIAESMKACAAAKERGEPLPNGILATEIVPGIFSASANAIRLWLEGVVSEQLVKPYHNFDPIRLCGTNSPDVALSLIRNETGSLPAIPAMADASENKSPGRPSLSQERCEEDAKIYDAWRSIEQSKGKPEFADEHGISEAELNRIIWRVGKSAKERVRLRFEPDPKRKSELRARNNHRRKKLMFAAFCRKHEEKTDGWQELDPGSFARTGKQFLDRFRFSVRKFAAKRLIRPVGYNSYMIGFCWPSTTIWHE